MNKVKQSRGILNFRNSQSKYQLKQFTPNDLLSPFVEQFWYVTWNLESKNSHKQKNLPQANTHFTFENQENKFYGPITKNFERSLIGKGAIFGIKFHVGAFPLIFKQEMSNFNDRITDLSSILSADFHNNSVFINNTLERALAIGTETVIDKKINLAELFLDRLIYQPQSPYFIKNSEQVSKKINEITHIVELIEQDSKLTKVADLSSQAGISERSLQRMFKTYIGLSPKWLIRKNRIQELLLKLDSTSNIETIDWQQLVVDLDYVDQAHLINDFKYFVGSSPKQYLNR